MIHPLEGDSTWVGIQDFPYCHGDGDGRYFEVLLDNINSVPHLHSFPYDTDEWTWVQTYGIFSTQATIGTWVPDNIPTGLLVMNGGRFIGISTGVHSPTQSPVLLPPFPLSPASAYTTNSPASPPQRPPIDPLGPLAAYFGTSVVPKSPSEKP